jgi:tetratricopeptide (TPR) repeat protein
MKNEQPEIIKKHAGWIGKKTARWIAFPPPFFILHFTFYTLTSCTDRTDEAAQFFLRGKVQLQKREYKEAIRFYNEAIKKKTDFADAYSNRGLARLRNGDTEAALADFTLAIEKDKTFEAAHLNRADAFLMEGNPQAALTDLQTIQETYADSTFYQTRLGEAYASLNQPAQAQAAFDKAVRLDPHNAEALTNRAALAYNQKQYAAALTDLKKALNINAEQPEALNNYALLLARDGKYAEALGYVDKALALKPGQPYYLNNKGYCLLMLGRNAEALPLVQDALRFSDRNAWAHRNMGIYHLRQQDALRALKALQEAERLDPSVEHVYGYLGQAYRLSGKKNEACRAWQMGKRAGDELAIRALNSPSGAVCQ